MAWIGKESESEKLSRDQSGYVVAGKRKKVRERSWLFLKLRILN